MARRVLLLVLDGWGVAPAGPENAISLARTPNFDLFWSKYPHTLLAASGEAVGLPHGQIGNSEVGHLNIGAGRTVLQDLPRINNAVRDGSFYKNVELIKLFDYVNNKGKKAHLLGLVSPGGVHTHQNHLYALLQMAKDRGVKDVYIHAFTDGRDTCPKSAMKYIGELEEKIKQNGVGKIATVSGRYYAMDRDNRWDRTNLCYNALLMGRGEIAASSLEAIENSYQKNITDEFIKPAVIDNAGLIDDGDGVVFFNFRSDRPRQLTKALIQKNFNGFKREKIAKDLYFVTMTQYEKDLKVTGVAFAEEKVKNCLEEVLAEHDKKQFHLAETEKYPHVTYFFNGLNEQKRTKEDWKLIPSPKVATYDLQPEMSAPKIAAELTERLGNFDFIITNFANLDMVGHTGKIPETIKAVETVDACLGGVVMAAKTAGYSIIITADHGNAEKMLNADGTPYTAHTTNPVPFILIDQNYKHLKYQINPTVGNIAPTILTLLNIEKPQEMKNRGLIEKRLLEEEHV